MATLTWPHMMRNLSILVNKHGMHRRAWSTSVNFLRNMVPAKEDGGQADAANPHLLNPIALSASKSLQTNSENWMPSPAEPKPDDTTINSNDNISRQLLFMETQGVSVESYKEIFKRNSKIIDVRLDDLKVRVDYLKSKAFTSTQIKRIITSNPFWLMYSIRRIDNRLGFFQETFQLSGNEVRLLCSSQPRLITYNIEHIRKSTFCLQEEFGMNKQHIKALLLTKPRIWMMNYDNLVERLSYVQSEMKLSHMQIVEFPEILTSRLHRIKQRHEFMKFLGRAQYESDKALYISPKSLVEGTERYFVTHIAHSDTKTYELFLKTL